MDPITFAQLNEAYHKGVYGQEETLDIQEWVEALIEEGYDLDQYTDEELYEAYLDEVKGGGKVDPHNPDPSRGMKHSPYVKAGIKQVGIENQTIHRENEIRRKHKAPRVDPWEDPSDPDYREPPLRVMQATNRANRAAATDPKMLRLNKRYQKIGNVMDNMKENLDLYDLVSEYLVSEGFCDSYEDADVIMANMSEEWRESILEGAADQSDKQIDKGIATTHNARGVLVNQRSPALNYRVHYADKDNKIERMKQRIENRRKDLFKEKDRREDEKNEKLKRILGL